MFPPEGGKSRSKIEKLEASGLGVGWGGEAQCRTRQAPPPTTPGPSLLPSPKVWGPDSPSLQATKDG